MSVAHPHGVTECSGAEKVFEEEVGRVSDRESVAVCKTEGDKRWEEFANCQDLKMRSQDAVLEVGPAVSGLETQALRRLKIGGYMRPSPPQPSSAWRNLHPFPGRRTDEGLGRRRVNVALSPLSRDLC